MIIKLIQIKSKGDSISGVSSCCLTLSTDLHNLASFQSQKSSNWVSQQNLR